MRQARAVLAGLVLSLLLLNQPFWTPDTAADSDTTPYATDYPVAEPFRAFYAANGGLEIFGLPLTDLLDEDGRAVQYFERNRFEYHPEHAGTPNAVLLGLLGRELAAGRDFAPGDPGAEGYMPETGHTLRGAFRAYWQAHDGLRLFGYPLSEELPERSEDDGRVYTVQYFERARMEWHPENAPPAQVLLGRLGAQAWEQRVAARGRQPAPPVPGGDAVAVDAAATIQGADRRVIGMNTNFITDHSGIRDAGQGYATALRQLGVKSLRYPGGEKADNYLWSVPPFTAPAPTLARTGPDEWPSNDPRWLTPDRRPLDFDEFMAYAKELGAEPTVVVAFDSMYKPATAGGTAPTKQQLLDTAVAWVRYANVVKGYGVKYWEIGNESYKDAYNGGATAANYARDLSEFSRAMKAVDPTIKIGANGPDSQYGRGELDSGGYWWQTVLEAAAPDIDFLAVHSYPAWQWGGYEYYRTRTPSLTGAADGAAAALAAWAPAHAGRIRIAVTEMNSADWSAGGWPSEDHNTLGHAVVLFEMIGAHLLHPRVDHAQVWNTRWVNAATPDLWNALDQNNYLLSSGRAVAIWGQFLEPTMVATTSSAMVRTFGSYDPATGRLSVFLLNKDTVARPTSLTLRNYRPAYSGALWSLRGAGPEDKAPTWGKVGDIAGADAVLSLTLDPVSVTVVTLTPPPGQDGSWERPELRQW